MCMHACMYVCTYVYVRMYVRKICVCVYAKLGMRGILYHCAHGAANLSISVPHLPSYPSQGPYCNGCHAGGMQSTNCAS